MKMNKDSSIIELLKKLDLEKRKWAIVDHWDDDLCAIGITTKMNRVAWFI